MVEKGLAQRYGQIIVQYIELDCGYSARLVRVEPQPCSSKWLAHIVIGEIDGKAEWEDSEGRTVYARQFSVEFTPVPNPRLAPVREAKAIVEEYKRVKFISPA